MGRSNKKRQICYNYYYYYYCYYVVLVVVIVVSCHRPLLPGTSHEPTVIPFQFHTAVLSVLCVMFQVQLSSVVNLLNVFLVGLATFSLNVLLLFRRLQLVPVC